MKNYMAYLSWIDSVSTGTWLVFLIILLGVLYQTIRKKGIANFQFVFGVFLLVALSFYPFYTSFFEVTEVGILIHLVILFITLIYMISLQSISKRLSKFLIPQLLWLFVVTIYLGMTFVDQI